MAKNKKDNIIIDFENRDADIGEDLLAEKNRNILSAFGNNAPSGVSSINTNANAAGAPRVSPLEALKARMKTANASGSTTEAAPVKAPKAEEKPQAAVALEEKSEPVSKPPVSENAPDQSRFEKILTPAANKEEDSSDKGPSLLEKLKRYTIDESGKNVSENEIPLYKLESVAEIIKNDSNKIINKLSEKYNVTVDTLGKKTSIDYILDGFEDTKEPEKPEAKPAAEEKTSEKIPTPEFKKLTSESKQRFEKNIFDELFPENGEKKAPTAEETKNSVPDISDIDNPAQKDGAKADAPAENNTTVRFTPIIDKTGNTGRINISSTTKLIDIKQELTSTSESDRKDSETPFEMSDFDLFAQKDEITDPAVAKATLRKLAYKKRRNFVTTVLCGLCVFVLLLFLIPFLSDKIISSPGPTMAFCGVLFLITVLANADMFADLYNLFKGKASHDCLVSLCAILGIPFCALSAIGGKNSYYHILLASLIMFTRAFVNLLQTSTTLSNLRQISGNRTKNAVAFIKDNATARAMAKDAIESDVLIAAPRKTEFISDFMKYSFFKKKFSGRMPIVFTVTAVLAALGSLVSFLFYKNVFDALTAAAVTSMVAAMPAICFIDVLPLYCAAKNLNKKGAMLAGTFGADSIELANAAVVKTSDIFPSGSITLRNLKVLSENDIDRTIVNAAALTDEAGSPLAPLFNQIAGTNASYKKPDSDTIKYEEKLGISGWVDNKLLFIGNRTLMQAHGIEVPDIEVDHKILRSGCFPVYVATGGVACALLVIEYHARPDIRKVLSKISKLGITLLVDNCDQNVSEKMICDYFGLYEDSVKVMTNVGVHMYKNAASDISVISAPASFKGSRLSLLRIMLCASNIRISNMILSVLYVLSAVFGVWFFITGSFASAGGLLSGGAILVFELLATIITLIAFSVKKP
ncbi:MAG: hypothetical protein IKZ47_01840 [Clostridia bacterium]|nr:hypothetical protein [Clostridia bacterium]